MLIGNRDPNPDFWIAKIFRDLVGPQVLDIRPVLRSSSSSSAVAASRALFAYAHGSLRFPHGSSGQTTGMGAVYLFINTSPDETFEISMSAAAGLMSPRLEYHVDGGAAGLKRRVGSQPITSPLRSTVIGATDRVRVYEASKACDL